MLVVTLLVQPAVCADDVTISFSDLNVGRNLDIEVYQPSSNGSQLVAEVNSTGVLELDSNYDYISIIKPAADIWFINPLNSFELLRISLPTFLSTLCGL